jgi:hypothetical protein
LRCPAYLVLSCPFLNPYKSYQREESIDKGKKECKEKIEEKRNYLSTRKERKKGRKLWKRKEAVENLQKLRRKSRTSQDRRKKKGKKKRRKEESLENSNQKNLVEIRIWNPPPPSPDSNPCTVRSYYP